MIKLFWWRPKDKTKINLGDEIGPHIVKVISGQGVRRANLRNCDMISVGSILGHAVGSNVMDARTSPIHVWGSGAMKPVFYPAHLKYTYAAVRGPLTLSLLENCSFDLPVGDPGILVSRLWAGASTPEHSWGIIPHHTQLRSPEIAALHASTPKSVIVDLTDHDIFGTLRKLSGCERIASTSLHGLIFADAYGIPSAWLHIRELHPGNSWKFYDHFAAVGSTRFQPAGMPTSHNLNQISPEHIRSEHLANVPAVQDQIEHCFPLRRSQAAI